MKALLWLIVGAIVVAAIMEQETRSSSTPILPSIQPQGCLPGDPSFSIGGRTWCLPAGVITY